MGTYQLTVTGRSIEGERVIVHTKKVTLIVKGSECPGFTVSADADPASGPSPLTVQFTARIEEVEPAKARVAVSGEGDYDYQWAFGDGGTSQEENPVHTYQKAGTYKAVLTVTNRCGVSEKDEAVVTVFKGASPFVGTLEKSFSPATVLPGEETDLTLTVRNTTQSDFTNVTVLDDIPEDLVATKPFGSVHPSRSGSRLTWSIAKIAPGESVTFGVRCKVNPEARPRKVANTAYLTHASLDSPIASNTAFLRIGFPDVKIEKSVNLREAKPGDRIVYTLKVLNRSRITLPAVEITDTLSDWLEFLSQDAPFTFEKAGNRLTWRGPLEAKKTYEIKITAKLKWNVPFGTRISNQAFLTSDTGGVKKHSETVWTSVGATQVATSKIGFRKKAEIPQVDVGRIIRFRLIIHNGSRYPLLSPVIDDYLPQGFSYVKGSSVYDGRRLTDPEGQRRLRWRLPVIPPGGTAVLKYQTIIGTSARRGKNINRAILNVTDNAGKTYRLEAKALVSVSAQGFTFTCAVEGNVYLDVNRDGIYSPGDKPLEGVEVVLSRGERTVTDKEGYFIFDDLYPGEYLLGVNTVKLPERYKILSPSPLSIILMDGLTDYQEFLVGFRKKPYASLTGFVFIDKNGDGMFEKREFFPLNFQVVLDKAVKTSGRNGRFRFSRLKPGKHVLEIQSGGHKKRVEVDVKSPKTEIRVPLPYHRLNILIQRGKR